MDDISEKKTPVSSKDDKNPKIALNIGLSNYLNTLGEIPELIKVMKSKIRKNDTEKIDYIIMKMLIYLYSQKKLLNAYIINKLVFPLLTYINANKTVYKQNIIKIFELFSNFLEEDSTLNVLFDKSTNSLEKEQLELYLDILIPFIFDKNLSSIISSLNNYLETSLTKRINTIIDGLEIKSAKALVFLRNILFIIVKLKGESFQGIISYVKEYREQEKNEFLRCCICADFPKLILDDNKNISIKYSCNHCDDSYINPNEIKNLKLECFDCKEQILFIKKNFLCSNCKHLFCFNCKQNHFINCLTIFFIPLTDIGLICDEHNNRFETFCSICNKNLCQKCKEEHEHYSNYSETLTFKEYKEKIDIYIQSGKKIEEPYISLIKLILSDDKYLANFQFGYFIKNLLGEKSEHECGFFEEFGNKKFNDYYFTLISEYKKANLFYIQIYKKIKNVYSENNLIINSHTISLTDLLINNENDFRTYKNNVLKASLLINYFTKLYDLKSMLIEEDNLLEKYNSEIKKEENKIKLNLISAENNKYKAIIIRLLNRIIVNYILRNLVENYPLKFKQITFNLKLYNDIKENFKGNKEYITKLEEVLKEKINQLLNNAKINTNNSGNNSEENEVSEDYTNEITFCKAIEKESKTISVEDLNNILEYLFTLKDDGINSAHPKDDNVLFSQTKNELRKNNDKNIKENQIIEILTNSLLNLKLKNKINIINLLECIFTGKYDELLLKMKIQEIKKLAIIEEVDYPRINDELSDEFRKIENTLNSFKSDYKSLLSYVDNNLNKGQITLKDFYERLYKSISEKDSAIKLLRNIFNFDYKNCLLGNMSSFIKRCFGFIINDAVKNGKNILKKFEKLLNEKRTKRKEIKILLEKSKKFAEKTEGYKTKEKENEQNSIIYKFIEHINSKNSKKIDYTQAKTICESMKGNLKILLKDTIILPKYEKLKLSSLLCLYQNQKKQ